ncbi:MAG: hypothetical protein PHH54_05350 [Candidatus Nanoarchaeia archaeon]|nr:hypothetical protein [Candidatus Nanoarchaeia archaeon]MDD5741384.1 hypothetical protein [Candidatus Nanoarchaeia archaeon]
MIEEKISPRELAGWCMKYTGLDSGLIKLITRAPESKGAIDSMKEELNFYKGHSGFEYEKKRVLYKFSPCLIIKELPIEIRRKYSEGMANSYLEKIGEENEYTFLDDEVCDSPVPLSMIYWNSKKFLSKKTKRDCLATILYWTANKSAEESLGVVSPLATRVYHDDNTFEEGFPGKISLFSQKEIYKILKELGNLYPRISLRAKRVLDSIKNVDREMANRNSWKCISGPGLCALRYIIKSNIRKRKIELLKQLAKVIRPYQVPNCGQWFKDNEWDSKNSFYKLFQKN